MLARLFFEIQLPCLILVRGRWLWVEAGSCHQLSLFSNVFFWGGFAFHWCMSPWRLASWFNYCAWADVLYLCGYHRCKMPLLRRLLVRSSLLLRSLCTILPLLRCCLHALTPLNCLCWWFCTCHMHVTCTCTWHVDACTCTHRRLYQWTVISCSGYPKEVK